MPTFAVFRGGKKVQQMQGADSRALEELVRAQVRKAAARPSSPPSPKQTPSLCQFEIRMYTADWCRPCKDVVPTFSELRRKLADDASNIKLTTVEVVDPDARPAHVEVLPSFVVYRDGEKVEQLSGAHKDELKTLCKK